MSMITGHRRGRLGGHKCGTTVAPYAETQRYFEKLDEERAKRQERRDRPSVTIRKFSWEEPR